jgi:hypothetical protein
MADKNDYKYVLGELQKADSDVGDTQMYAEDDLELPADDLAVIEQVTRALDLAIQHFKGKAEGV